MIKLPKSCTPTQCGKTETEEKVVKNVFKMYDTIGLPLDCILDKLKDSNMKMDVPDFYEQAVKAGWKKQKVKAVLSEAYCDVYGKEFRDEVLKRLEDND